MSVHARVSHAWRLGRVHPARKAEECGQMGPPKPVLLDVDLAELEWVFQSVCSALDYPGEQETVSIRRRLFLLACNGMNDPELIRTRLIENFAQSNKPKRGAACLRR